MNEPNVEMKECIDNCVECSRVCVETVSHCLAEGGEHAKRSHISLLLICADICEVSAEAMMLENDLHHIICRACAEICEACAKECEGWDDIAMSECAEICQKCAVSCRDMAAISTGDFKNRSAESRAV